MKLADLTEQFLRVHMTYHPVDASFMGYSAFDPLLPPADSDAVARETAALTALEQDLTTLPLPNTAAERINLAMLKGQLKQALKELELRPRYHNPSWYTGEAAFGIISVLLNESLTNSAVLGQRLEHLPRFLTEGAAQLSGKATPAVWTQRAEKEAAALTRLLSSGLQKHPLWRAELTPAVEAALDALLGFARQLDQAGSADPACGEAYLDFLMQQVHYLPFKAREAERLADDGYQQLLVELENLAQHLNPAATWQEQLDHLSQRHPNLDDVIPTYSRFHEEAMRGAVAASLLSPAQDYGLTVKPLPAWAEDVAGDLYFLFYRSPALKRPGEGSVYWVFPPGDDLNAYLQAQNFSTIKITHAVHHGSVGHHTQNARARASQVQLGQLAGTDCAAGIALLGGGTMIEGWACYAQDLMLEVDGFYSPQEHLLLKHAELRNAAMCLADIRLHLGVWQLEDVIAFYAEIGIPTARAQAEAVRNSIYPATRLMYWLGTKAIKDLRAELGWDARTFHDTLLSFGSVPVYLAAAEMRRATARQDSQ